PLAVCGDREARPLMRLTSPIPDLNAERPARVRLHPQMEGGHVGDAQLPEVADGGHVSAAGGEVAGELQTRLARGRLVLDAGERARGALEFLPPAEPPVVLPLDDLVKG